MTKKKSQKQLLQSTLLALFLWIGLKTTPAVSSAVEKMEEKIDSNQQISTKDVPFISFDSIVKEKNESKRGRDLTATSTDGLKNLALSGTASQSSTYEHYPASKAIDGNTSGEGNLSRCHYCISHTDYGYGNWWMVDLKGVFVVKKIIIWNRTDYMPERLNGAILKVLGNDETTVLGSFNLGVVTIEPKSFDMNISGASFVRIELPRSDFMQLGEVQVFGFVPPPDDSVTHTSQGLKSSWEVDLKGIFHTKKIVILNRTECCKATLNGAVVKVLGEDGNTILGSYGVTGVTSQTKFEFDLNIPKVSSIILELPSTNGYLTIAKVQDLSDQSFAFELSLYLYPIQI